MSRPTAGSPPPPATDPIVAAWEAALAQRLAELDRLASGRRWAPAREASVKVLEGLARAEPELVQRHAAAVHRLAAISVRAAWESAPPATRIPALEASFLAAIDFAPDLRLQDVLDLDERPPPEWPALLPRWSRVLGDWGGRWRQQEAARGRLQREALRLDLGADGLAALAAQSDELDVWLAWLEALVDEGRLEEALRGAAAGARSLYWPRHRLELRLREGAIAARLGHQEQAHKAWREVWRSRLCTAGLCMVWSAAGPLASPFFREELELAYSLERPLPVDLQVRIELLTGDAEVPLARLQAAVTTGWWDDPLHPATQVLPFLLRVGTGQPVLDETLLIARIWRATDDDQRWRPRPPDPIPPGWSSLVDQVVATHPTWLVDAVTWRVNAGNVLVELAGAVIDARARGAYLKVAALLVALVEAGTVAQDPEADAPLRAIARRFPRHKALLQTIDETRACSPALRGAGPRPR